MEQSKQEMELSIVQKALVIQALGEQAETARVYAVLDILASVTLFSMAYTQRMEWYVMDGAIAVAVLSLYNLTRHAKQVILAKSVRLQLIVDADTFIKSYKAKFPPEA